MNTIVGPAILSLSPPLPFTSSLSPSMYKTIVPLSSIFKKNDPYFNQYLHTNPTSILSLHFQNSDSEVPISPLPNSSDPYIILNLSPNASKKEIKIAYRQAALRYHPDARTNVSSTAEEREDANDDFARINAAYAFLTGKSDRPNIHNRATRKRTTRVNVSLRTPNYSGYGGTSSEAHVHKPEKRTICNRNTSHYTKEAPTSKYTHLGYGGTTSAWVGNARSGYGGTTNDANVRKSRNSSNHVRYSVGYTTGSDDSTQAQSKAGTSHKYTHLGYGGTSSKWGKHDQDNTPPTSSQNRGVTSDSTSGQNKRISWPSSAYASQGYGGTSSAYIGKQSKHKSPASMAPRRTHSIPNHHSAGRRKDRGDFSDAKSFQEKWNTVIIGNNIDGSPPSISIDKSSQNYDRDMGNYTHVSHKVGQTEIFSRSGLSKSAPTQKYRPNSGDFFDADKFHSTWNPSTNSNNGANNLKSSHFLETNELHDWSSSGDNTLQNPAKIIKDAKELIRCSKTTLVPANLKHEEVNRSNGFTRDDFEDGSTSMIAKNWLDLLNSPKSSQTKTISIPSPTNGLQFSPYEACAIIEKHEGDVSMDESKAMSVMLKNHYVPTRQPQFLAIYRRYKDGKISQESRWEQLDFIV